MCPHIPNHEVEGEEVVANFMTAVEKDAVHASVEEWLSFPEVLHIYQEVEQREEDEGKAGGDHDVGDGPEVLVDRNPAIILACPTK